MKTRFATLLLMLMAFAVVSGQTPATGGKPMASPGGADAIKAVADAYVKAALAGDAKALAALYATDAVEMPPNQPLLKGRAAIQQYYEKEMGAGMKMNSFTLSHLDTYASGDRGYDVGTFQQSITPTGSSSPMSDTGKYTVILKRSGSTWQIAYAIYNSDQAPPKQ